MSLTLTVKCNICIYIYGPKPQQCSSHFPKDNVQHITLITIIPQTFILPNFSKSLCAPWVTVTNTVMASCVWLDFRYFWRKAKHFLLCMTLVCVLYWNRRLKALLMHFLQSIWKFITTIIIFILNLQERETCETESDN